MARPNKFKPVGSVNPLDYLPSNEHIPSDKCINVEKSERCTYIIISNDRAACRFYNISIPLDDHGIPKRYPKCNIDGKLDQKQ